MAITTKQQRQQRHNEAVQLISGGGFDDHEAATDFRDWLQ